MVVHKTREGWAIDGIWPQTQLMWTMVPLYLLKTPKSQFLYQKKQYNQDNFWANSCTLAASMWAVTDNHWIVFSDAEWKEIYKEAVNRWLDPKVGWYVHKAVDLVTDRTNKEKKTNLMSAWCKVWSNEYKAAMLLWFSVITWYWGNAKYNTDRTDWVIDNWNYGSPTYRHAIRHFTNYNLQVNVVDNYFWDQINIYRNPMVEEILNDWKHFNWWFVIFDPASSAQKTAQWLKLIAMRKNLSAIQ